MEVLNMFYFSKNDETIKKYQVNFDKEEIEKIKTKIINNCSRRTHVIRESTLAPNELVNNPLSENISYLEMKNTGRTNSYSDTTEDKTLYEYDYILFTRFSIILCIRQPDQDQKPSEQAQDLRTVDISSFRLVHHADA